ncbi:MAG: hypothetical protein SOX94_07025 [Prevotella sp.]|nr:hypothetical protein [Prevotella sp.]MDY4161240.1 hypothetical protein [Prevotella sp.]
MITSTHKIRTACHIGNTNACYGEIIHNALILIQLFNQNHYYSCIKDEVT